MNDDIYEVSRITAEVEAILSEPPPNTGPVAVEIREATLADEVLRLRAQAGVLEARWASLRAKVVRAFNATDTSTVAGNAQWCALDDVQVWMDAAEGYETSSEIGAWLDAAEKAGEEAEDNG